MKKDRLSVFWKCFLTYLCSTLILLGVQFYSFAKTSSLWQKSYTDQIEASLNHNAQALSDDLANFYYLPKLMNISDNFRSLTRVERASTPQHSRYISFTMNDLSDQVPFFMPVHDIIVHLRTSDMCISTSSFYLSLEEWASSYKYGQTDVAQALSRKLARNSSLEMLPCDTVSIRGSASADYVTCLMKESADNCSYIFLIQKEDILNYFQLQTLPESVYFRVYDKNGSMIMESGVPAERSGLLAEDFVTFTTEIPAIGASSSISIPESYFRGVTHEARRSAYVITILSLIVGAALCVAFSRINAQPVQALIRSQDIPQDKQSTNELVTIYNYLSESKEQRRSMQEKLRSSLILRAFAGLPVSAEDYAGISEEGLFLPSARIAVARYRSIHENQEFLSLVLYQLKEHMPREFIIEPLNRQEIGLVLPPNEEAVFILKEYLDEVNRGLEGSNQFICGVSAPFSGPEGISVAVQQARFSLPSGSDSFSVFSEENRPEPKKTRLPDYKEFQNALFNWNIKKAESMIQEFADAVMKESSAVAQEVFYTLLAAIKDAASAIKADPEEYHEYSYKRSISADANIRTLGELMNGLFEKKRSSQTDEKSLRNRQIINYVNNHFDDPTLCPAAIAALYDRSERTINTILNEETGMSFSGYLTTVRMQKAGQMLRETTLDAAAVSEKCGLTTSTFYRNFKKHYHMTPAEYKAQFSTAEQSFSEER